MPAHKIATKQIHMDYAMDIIQCASFVELNQLLDELG